MLFEAPTAMGAAPAAGSGDHPARVGFRADRSAVGAAYPAARADPADRPAAAPSDLARHRLSAGGDGGADRAVRDVGGLRIRLADSRRRIPACALPAVRTCVAGALSRGLLGAAADRVDRRLGAGCAG